MQLLVCVCLHLNFLLSSSHPFAPNSPCYVSCSVPYASHGYPSYSASTPLWISYFPLPALFAHCSYFHFCDLLSIVANLVALSVDIKNKILPFYHGRNAEASRHGASCCQWPIVIACLHLNWSNYACPTSLM